MSGKRWVVCGLVVLCVASFARAGESREAPRATKLAFIEASLEAVAKNGVAARVQRKYGEERADGSRAVPVKHVVRCSTASDCKRVAEWARRTGLEPSAARLEHGHGSIPYFLMDLRQKLPLESKRIQAETLRVHEALEGVDGARYETWMVDVDPEGRHAR